MRPTLAPRRNAGVCLADVLIASVILTAGVLAAASLAFSMNTQEEISARVARGTAMAESAAALYSLGLAPATVLQLLPTDPILSLSAGTESAETVSGDLNLRFVEFTVTINTVDDVGSWSAGYWTGGGNSASPRQRTLTVRAYRSSHQLRNDQ